MVEAICILMLTSCLAAEQPVLDPDLDAAAAETRSVAEASAAPGREKVAPTATAPPRQVSVAR